MIVTVTDLSELRSKYARKKIVLASGVFDLLHAGHTEYLQSLKNYGDITVVIVKPDSRVKKYKHPNRPIIAESERVRMVDAIKGVDYVVLGSDFDATLKADLMYEEIFNTLQPDVFVSSNNTWAKLSQITAAKVYIVPKNDELNLGSTTAIISRIRSLDSC